MPHQRYGETVACWIKLRDPTNKPTEQEIKDFCKDKVRGVDFYLASSIEVYHLF